MTNETIMHHIDSLCKEFELRLNQKEAENTDGDSASVRAKLLDIRDYKDILSKLEHIRQISAIIKARN